MTGISMVQAGLFVRKFANSGVILQNWAINRIYTQNISAAAATIANRVNPVLLGFTGFFPAGLLKGINERF